jgi:hypothetical protein
MSSKIPSLAMSDEQLEAFAKACKQVEERVQRGEIQRDKASIDAALQIELNKTFPKGYPVPTIDVFSDINSPIVGAYDDKTNRLFVNLAYPTEDWASTIAHEREHAVQAKKVSDGIAAELADQGIPVTAENIVAASKASATLGLVNGKGEPVLDARGKQQQGVKPVQVSPAVAEQAAKDYNSGKRLSPAQRQESKKLRKVIYSREGLIERDRITKNLLAANSTLSQAKQLYISAKSNYDKANIPGTPKEKLRELKKLLDNAEARYKKSINAYNKASSNYRNGLFDESQAYAVGDRFINKWRGLGRTKVFVNQTEGVTSSIMMNQENNQSTDKSNLQIQSEQVYSKTLAMAPKNLALTDDQRVAKALISANFDASTVAAVIENGSPKAKTMDESAKGDYAQGVAKTAEANKENEASQLASASKTVDQGIQV